MLCSCTLQHVGTWSNRTHVKPYPSQTVPRSNRTPVKPYLGQTVLRSNRTPYLFSLYCSYGSYTRHWKWTVLDFVSHFLQLLKIRMLVPCSMSTTILPGGAAITPGGPVHLCGATRIRFRAPLPVRAPGHGARHLIIHVRLPPPTAKMYIFNHNSD